MLLVSYNENNFNRFSNNEELFLKSKFLNVEVAPPHDVEATFHNTTCLYVDATFKNI